MSIFVSHDCCLKPIFEYGNPLPPITKYNLVATCPEEVKPYLRQEIDALGGEEVFESFRAVGFSAQAKLFYESHLKLRLASRIYRVLKQVPAQNPIVIFDKTKRIPFHKYFKAQDAIKINVLGRSGDSRLPTHLVGSKIREAITDSFIHFTGQEPNLKARDPRVSLIGFINGNRLSLCLDTTGRSLHKRGYRVEGHEAPLKETLAATLLKICDFRGERAFFDPMCGSGTLLIEAAQIALNKSPLIHRKKDEFGFEHLLDHDKNLWRQVQDHARDERSPTMPAIYGCDIEADHLDITQAAARLGRVEKWLTLSRKDFFKSQKPCQSGLMIMNLPYGKRMEVAGQNEAYFAALGDRLKNHYQGWTVGILAEAESPYKAIGLKPKKSIRLQNGKIPVVFLVFDIWNQRKEPQ